MTSRRTSRPADTKPSLETRRLLISGIVQGVGFRYALLHAARRLGANGWVRNRRDGRVEAVVQGTADTVESMITWAQRGPEGAQVTGVDVSEDSGTYFGFEIRDTV